MKTMLKIILVSWVSWFLFIGLDSLVLPLYGFKYSSSSNIFPPWFFFCYAIVCFIAFGFFSGCIAGIVHLITKVGGWGRRNTALLSAFAVSVALNCTLNIYVLNPWSLRFRATGIVIGFCLLSIVFFSCIFMKLGGSCKRLMSAVIAYSLGIELFWIMIRNCSRGLLIEGLGNNPVVVCVAALAAGSALFFNLYFIVPLIYQKLKKERVLSTAFFLVFLLVIYSFARGEKKLYEHHDTRPNIVLIILDTLRADHVSCYGYAKKTTPQIDRFAQESLFFKNAYATASWTLPSIASMLTGTYSGYHGAHRVASQGNPFNSSGLSDESLTLAEVLEQNGYYTSSFVSSDFVGRHFGLGQGFQYLDDLIPNYFYIINSYAIVEFLNLFIPVKDYLHANGYYAHRVAGQINKLALSWLQNYESRKPLFMLLHYFDPHDPYMPEQLGISSEYIPKPIILRYGQRRSNYVELERSLIYNVMKNKKPLLQEEKDLLIGNYDVEISRTDQRVNEVFNALKMMKIYDNSIIVIVSDHGESFGEHGLLLHGLSLYEDNLRVPLIIKFPAKDQRRGVIDKDVSLAGLAPTILSYLDIPIPETMQGSSYFGKGEQKILAQIFRDSSSENREGTKPFDQDLISLKQGKYKFIKSIGGKDELFDVELDPLECNNLVEEEKEIADSLSAQIKSDIDTFGLLQKKAKNIHHEVGRGTIQNLKALGYIQ